MSETHLSRFDTRWGLSSRQTTCKPILLLASGWRSGSTLLQRLVCSSGEVIVWGEPYGRAGIIPALARSSLCLRDEWPTEGHYPPDAVYERLHDHWIANLYPPATALRRSFEVQLQELFETPARQRGFSRFGLKEVRLHAIDARFLQWIYPDARFVFLVRNPFDAWASARGGKWVLRWPDQVIDSAVGFARHWRRLTEGFINWNDASGLLLRYEDLIAPGFDLDTLQVHCELKRMDPTVLQRRIRGIAQQPSPLSQTEIGQIRVVVGDLAERLGYFGPTASVSPTLTAAPA